MNEHKSILQCSFTYENMQHPRLVELRERESLQQVIAGGNSDFEHLVLLRHWTASQWQHDHVHPYPPHDALAILDNARGGGGGHCGQYSMVYLQACLALGYQTRAIEIGRRQYAVGHFLTESWVPEYRKWAVMDADNHMNCHYTLMGSNRPLSALEIHKKVVAGKADDINIECMWPEGINSKPGRDTKLNETMAIEQFYYLRVLFKQDFLNNPIVIDLPANTFDRFETAVEWTDDDTVPWESSEFSVDFLPHPNEPLCRRHATRVEDLYWEPMPLKE